MRKTMTSYYAPRQKTNERKEQKCRLNLVIKNNYDEVTCRGLEVIK